MSQTINTHAIVLFAHGSRDPNWRRPFESMLIELKAQHTGPVALGFLENMEPDLEEAIAQTVSAGAKTVLVVPLFLAVGGHLRKDLPILMDQAKQRFRGITIEVSEAAGENIAVQRSLVQFALQHSITA